MPLVFLTILISCADDQPETRNISSAGTPVEIIHPQIENFTEFINLNANTVFLKKEIIRATFQGFIAKINKNIGDQVNSGDLILTIKTKESAVDDSLRIKLGTEVFKGSVEIHAHSAGVLTILNYNSGDFVSEGEEIAIILNPSSLYFTLNVPFSYVMHIDRDKICKIFLPDDTMQSAIIQRIIPSVDPVAQTQTFLLRPEHSIILPENLNVTAQLPLQTVKNAVVLPRHAILSNETQNKFWVMQIINDSTAVKVNVQKGIENDSLIQIITPVFQPDDRIILNGAYGLPDTANITIIQ